MPTKCREYTCRELKRNSTPGDQRKTCDDQGPLPYIPLREKLKSHVTSCTECGLCVKECAFLQRYGTPKKIAAGFRVETISLAFECSLCGLCTAVCPPKTGLDPAALFLEMRREAVARGEQDFSDYGVILNYEKRGTSSRYSYYALPENCNTVLFPGCTLPGTRPDKVKALFAHLQQAIPDLGIVLDCCSKPSHDLGRVHHFHAMFNEMKEYLDTHGVQNILVACPNCYRVFSQYGDTLNVKTVYEHLTETSLPASANISADVTVHDPCGTRNDVHIHAAIRRIAAEKSLKIIEMKHHGPKTLCCGEGGSVGCVNSDFAKGWEGQRKEEAGGIGILTYCAGCVNFLESVKPTMHVLDLLFDPEVTLAGQAKISKAPWTYLNRLRLKNHFKKKINATTCRVRTFTGENGAERGMLPRIVLLVALIAVLSAVHLSGVMQFVEQENQRAFVVFSSSMVDVLTGNVTSSFIIGILLIAGVSLFPLFYKDRAQKNNATPE